jgi:uncharacterized membrane protein YdbT with pleckstrin-like domain
MGDDEQVISIYRHHWFAYASVLFLAMCTIVALFGVVVALTQGSESMVNRQLALFMTGIFAVLVLLFSMILVYLKSQEKLVLSEDALYQLLQPTLFAGKVSQLSLAHVNDVSVRQDFFGTIFGYGEITIETPGEQNNYVFTVMAEPHKAAKEVIETHENFLAALEAGRLPTTLGSQHQARIAVDTREYQEFLEFQRMKEQRAKDQAQLLDSPKPDAPNP